MGRALRKGESSVLGTKQGAFKLVYREYVRTGSVLIYGYRSYQVNGWEEMFICQDRGC